jgi:choline dehydrogenase-like flavoprotein
MVIDQVSKQSSEYFAKIIFLNASCIPSTAILMQTETKRYGKAGLDESGALGHYLMDHHFHAGANGTFEGHQDKTTYGRRPNGIYIPRYRNFNEPANDYVRGFGYQARGNRQGWNRDIPGFGVEYKQKLTTLGNWQVNLLGYGECLPYHDNQMTLSSDRKDNWGLPLIEIDAGYSTNEAKMRKDMTQDAAEMLQALGCKNIRLEQDEPHIGLGIHEMGTARMGTDRKNSVLNRWNQVWAAPNVFVTDGACMTSSACVNPSLTYMALTARAADYAVNELKKGNL